MQNIQDLKEKIFFESKNIIDILDKINNVDELLSKQDLVDELANRISFLRLLEKNIEYFIPENSFQGLGNQQNNNDYENHDSGNEVTEEEAIFNNEFNEIDENEENTQDDFSYKAEEEAVFNNQLSEIVENELHEGIINFVEENESAAKENTQNQITGEEIFHKQLNEIEEDETSENQENKLNFVDEDLILANSEPEDDEGIHENMFNQETTEEEEIFNNQLNEIDGLENGNSQNKDSVTEERIPSIFDSEILEEEEILIEENEEQFISSKVAIEQGEMATDTSNVDNILSEIKNDAQIEEQQKEVFTSEMSDRRKIIEIDKPQIEKNIHPSDESFENTDAYHQEKKIKLANIKGLKGVHTLFDDDPLEREIPVEKNTEPLGKEEGGSILKTNIPTDFMEAEKKKPEFKLDLNDRIAFSKMLFGGSQSELNDVVSELNKFKTLDEAKEFLSDLYYSKKWNKVDEYAQRLWILVENKFL
ncbi:hypothetical protein ACM39_01540 [Chryseobacterium sp. FH2]|uniref:hypothetical protein n=1 Tax=Chryseobacterium sp. FH2 TaxID=1674291 RepID=UPI00065AA312|nr:hypothetical protein [Chryseobacterium sp. FH2]KMQ69759.1 hypothetical protein ACM39_01540 [Chryseobacterium sp. FH2]